MIALWFIQPKNFQETATSSLYTVLSCYLKLCFVPGIHRMKTTIFVLGGNQCVVRMYGL